MARVFAWLCRLGLAGIFIYAGVVKMFPPIKRDLFMLDLSTYQLLPLWAIVAVAWILPPFEVALGLALLSGWKLRYAAVVSGLLLLLFIAVMTITYMRGIAANCGCFGDGEQIGPRTLLRDSLILLPAIFLTVYAWWLRPRSTSAAAA